MERKLISFKCVYLIYLSILTLLVSGCIGYVYVLLNKYEEQRPERQVKLAIEKLAADASSGEFWNRYPLKEIEKEYMKNIWILRVIIWRCLMKRSLRSPKK